MRVPSRARGARHRRLELPFSSLARPPRFYVSTAGLARGEGFTPRAVDTRLWVACRRRRENSLASARECHGSLVTSGGRRRKDFDARGHPLGGVDTRARYSPRARATLARPRDHPGRPGPRDALPRPSPHAPTLPRTPRDGSLRPRGARGSLRGGDRYQTLGARKKRSSTFAFVLLLAFVALLAPMVYHHQHKDHPDARRVRDERVVVTLDEDHGSANHHPDQRQRRQRLPRPEDETRGTVDDVDGTETGAGVLPGGGRDGVGGVGRRVLSSAEQDDAAGVAGEMGSGSFTRKRRGSEGR